MQHLSDIKIAVDNPALETGNLPGILSEIEQALEELLNSKQVHRIDLRAMPWSAGEEHKLEQMLGRGEVTIELNALGKSIFQETRYSGVWLISHYNEAEELIGKIIEISFLPEMVFAQQEDISRGLERIKTLRSQDS